MCFLTTTILFFSESNSKGAIDNYVKDLNLIHPFFDLHTPTSPLEMMEHSILAHLNIGS